MYAKQSKHNPFVEYRFFFTSRYEYHDERFKHLLHIIDKWNDYLGTGLLELYLPILKHIPTKAKQGLRRCADTIIPFLEQAINDHKRDFSPDNLRDFIDAYLYQQKLHSQEDVDQNSWLTEENLRGNLFSLFVAGGDTTSSVLCWCLAYLTNNPAVQESIRQELDAVVGRDRFPSLSDRDNLPLTRAFILEVLRYSCIAPLGVSHAAAESVAVDGFNIPKGE